LKQRRRRIIYNNYGCEVNAKDVTTAERFYDTRFNHLPPAD
jgi:hypothetical protein